jgi:signal peptidase II
LIIIFLSIAAFIIFSLYEIKNENNTTPIVVSLGLILGGGLSNLFDRILLGGVSDYFDLIFWRMNLADIFIFVGIFVFFYNFLGKNRQKN